jgi:hypothetical protein
MTSWPTALNRLANKPRPAAPLPRPHQQVPPGDAGESPPVRATHPHRVPGGQALHGTRERANRRHRQRQGVIVDDAERALLDTGQPQHDELARLGR